MVSSNPEPVLISVPPCVNRYVINTWMSQSSYFPCHLAFRTQSQWEPKSHQFQPKATLHTEMGQCNSSMLEYLTVSFFCIVVFIIISSSSSSSTSSSLSLLSFSFTSDSLDVAPCNSSMVDMLELVSVTQDHTNCSQLYLAPKDEANQSSRLEYLSFKKCV